MKQMKSFFCMLLAALLLSTAVSAQTKTVTSTFTDVGDFRELVEGTGILGGTLFTSEGNSWGFGTLKRGDPGAASVGSSFALLLGGKAYTFYPSFNLKGYIKKVTVRAGGNLSQIYAYIPREEFDSVYCRDYIRLSICFLKGEARNGLT